MKHYSSIKIFVPIFLFCFGSIRSVQSQPGCSPPFVLTTITQTIIMPTVAGTSGEKQFTVTFSGQGASLSGVQVGSTYNISTCNGTTEDTYLYASGIITGSEVWCNSDHCGQQSQMDISPSSNIVYTVFVFEDNGGVFSDPVTITIQLVAPQGGGNAGGNGGQAGGPMWQQNSTGITYTMRNVGIGIDSPSEKLEVFGNANISGRLKVGPNSIIIDASTIPTSTGPENHIYSSNNNGGGLLIQSNPGNSFNTVLNKNGGKVGIGTLAPQKILHLKTQNGIGLGDNSTSIRIEKSLITSVVGLSALTTWDLEAEADVSDIGKFHIGTPSSPVMTLTEDGNAGIGTTAPGTVHEGVITKLEVVGNDHTAVTVDAPTDKVSSFVLAEAGNSTWHMLSRGSENDRFEIFSGIPSNFGAKMTILQNGSVGIGTTDPATGRSLHILGGPGTNSNAILEIEGKSGGFANLVLDGGDDPNHWEVWTPADNSFLQFWNGTGKMTISNNGDVNVATLSGSGTRMVTADVNGNLSTQIIPTSSGADNLGNHTATQSIKLSGNTLSNNGNFGMSMDNNGNASFNGGIGINQAADAFHSILASGDVQISGNVGINTLASLNFASLIPRCFFQ